MNNEIIINKDFLPKGLTFIKEVAKYFMDFLETDFHKRRNPRRNIKYHNESNLLVGIKLSRYPAFNELSWQAFNHVFDKDVLNRIEKGFHRTFIPNSLLELIRIQVENLTPNHISTIISKILEGIKQASILHKNEHDRALVFALECSSKAIRQDLVLPFINSIEKPLANSKLGDDNTVYLLEEELSDILLKVLEDKVSALVTFSIAECSEPNGQELHNVFEIKKIKKTILDFFETFKVTDLYSEILEMDRNRNILDKQEFYFYFCDISFNRAQYPIFYIPFSLGRNTNTLTIEFDSRIYINKRAIEYIAQEFNNGNNKKGKLKSISERIIYLTQHQIDFPDICSNVLHEIVQFFGLDNEINISKPINQIAKSAQIRLTNSCHISLFEKSNEAVVNDYEEILSLLESGNTILGDAFSVLIDDFIHNNPTPFNIEVEDEWDDTEIADKLVFRSPIPLNSEQRQILSAVNKDGCKYLTVEGPPGTGKSHTITAIVFNAILKNQSVLVLSDKKEALDVVENKITETMNKVRNDNNFQNPILRLGSTGSTYSQILSTTTINQIRTHYRAVKKDHDGLQENINKLENELKEELTVESLLYNEIDIKEIQELLELEQYYSGNGTTFDIDEALRNDESAIEFDEFRTICQKLKLCLSSPSHESNLMGIIYKHFGLSVNHFENIEGFQAFLKLLSTSVENAKKVKDAFQDKIESLKWLKKLTNDDFGKLKYFVEKYNRLKNKIFGFLFKRQQIQQLSQDFRKTFLFSKFEEPHKQVSKLKEIIMIAQYAIDLLDDNIVMDKIDYLKTVHVLLADMETADEITDLIKLHDDMQYLSKNMKKYPKTFNKIGADSLRFCSLCDNSFTQMNEIDFERMIRYIVLEQSIRKCFNRIPVFDYADEKKNLEGLVSAQMTYLMDERLINFYENNKTTAKALREIIRTKRCFPRDEFVKLKQSFPCILAGIRDYAEYIPLEPGIFDLVIIDESSQVSIAQSFPALLRAKKVIVLGDKKQFSNVKAAQARSDTNREYLNNLANVFRKNISEDTSKLVKLEKFNIKTSILEFFEFINNHDIQLLKHFRGYKELISYSNKHFYQNTLQVMKIRGKPIDDVLKFTFIKHDGQNELTPNTNRLEIDFIITELQNLKEKNSSASVGIITPHTNQQKLAAEMINSLSERDYFYDNFRLKIMTFDTCQGEERDIIYYSMVATDKSDHLWGVFIKDLNAVDLEEEGKIKAQRLNVGFSRSKECIHFVLSKPIENWPISDI